MQSRQWDSIVFNDIEEEWNWGNQVESKQPFLFYSASKLPASLPTAVNVTVNRGHTPTVPEPVSARGSYTSYLSYNEP